MKKFFPAVLLAALTFGVYAPAARNGFVWDDTALVLRDPLIRSWRLIPEGFQHFLFTDATASDFYRPMQRLLFTIDYAAVGFRPAAFHVTSILCHLFAAIALLFFARELLRTFDVEERRRNLIALISACVWAIHPLQSSAVAYVSGCADPLAAGFGFTALYLALVRPPTLLLTILSGIALLLSMLSKEAASIFPAVWLALAALRQDRKALLRAASVIAFVLVSYAVLRLSAEHTPAPTARPTPALVRPILMARAVAEYTALIAFPLHLQMERDVETHPFGISDESMKLVAWRELETLAGLLVIAAFTYWIVRERKRDRAVFTCLLCGALTYIPVSGLVPLNATLAEHWLYLPSAFLLLAAALRFPARTVTISLAALWIAFLGARTFVRTFDWKDQRTFVERTIATGGDSARMLINLGGLEMSEGRLEEARVHLDAALRKDPDQPLAVINAAALVVKQNDFTRARELLARATQMPLVEAQAHELLAVLEFRETGHANLLRMRLASRSGAPNWAIEKRYVQILDETGATDGAIAELQRCVETQWYRADSWRFLSQLLTKRGDAQGAREAEEQAHRYDVRL